MPCLLRWPGRLPAGKVSAQLGITMDLTATILAAAGTPPPAGRTLDGDGPAADPAAARRRRVERTLFWRIDRADRQQKAVRQGKWKYVQDGGIELLFDLEADVGERHDLAGATRRSSPDSAGRSRPTGRPTWPARDRGSRSSETPASVALSLQHF